MRGLHLKKKSIITFFFILVLYPLEAVIQPDSSIIPSAVSLKNNGRFIYANGSGRLFQLDRLTGDLRTIFSHRGSLYRYYFTKDNTGFLCYYENEEFIHYIKKQGKRYISKRLPLARPKGWADLFDRVFIDTETANAVAVSSQQSDRVVAVSTSIKKKKTQITVSRGGRVIHSEGRHLVYMTYTSQRYGRYMMSPSETIYYRDIISGKELSLYTFRSLYHTVRSGSITRNRLYSSGASGIKSEAGKIFGIHITDEHARKSFILFIDMKKSKPVCSVECSAFFSGDIPETGIWRMSRDDSLCFFSGETTGGRLISSAADILTGKITPLPGDYNQLSALPGGYWGYGILPNGYIWHHKRKSNTMLIVDPVSNTFSETNLLRFTGKPQVEWAGLTYFFPDPDEFYTSVEKGGSRYYIRFRPGDLKKPRKHIPAGRTVLSFLTQGRSTGQRIPCFSEKALTSKAEKPLSPQNKTKITGSVLNYFMEEKRTRIFENDNIRYTFKKPYHVTIENKNGTGFQKGTFEVLPSSTGSAVAIIRISVRDSKGKKKWHGLSIPDTDRLQADDGSILLAASKPASVKKNSGSTYTLNPASSQKKNRTQHTGEYNPFNPPPPLKGKPEDLFREKEELRVYVRQYTHYMIQKNGFIIIRDKINNKDTIATFTVEPASKENKWPLYLIVTKKDRAGIPATWTMEMPDEKTLKDKNRYLYRLHPALTSDRPVITREMLDEDIRKKDLLAVKAEGFTETLINTDPHPVMKFSVRSSVRYLVSPDGKRLIHFEELSRPVTEWGEKNLYIDNKPFARVISAGGFRFSPDSRRVAYYAVAQTGKTGKKIFRGKLLPDVPETGLCAFFDGETDKKVWDNIWFLHFSPDGKRTAYQARKGKKYYVVIDGVIDRGYDLARVFTFSANNRDSMYIAQEGKMEYLILNGKKAVETGQVSKAGFSKDGNSWYCLAFNNNKYSLYVNGKEITQPGYEIFDVYFSDDGKTLYYLAENKSIRNSANEFVFINHKRIQEAFTISISTEFEHFFSISPDGKNFAFIEPLPTPPSAGYFSGRVVINARRNASFHRHFLSNITFSPDGKRHFYNAAMVGRGGWIVENSRKGHLNAVYSPTFSPDSRLYYWDSLLEDARHISRVYRDHKKYKNIEGYILTTGKFSPYSSPFIFNKNGDIVKTATRAESSGQAQYNGKEFFMKNFRAVGGPYDLIETLEYSYQNNTFFGVAFRNKKMYLVRFR